VIFTGKLPYYRVGMCSMYADELGRECGPRLPRYQ